MQEPGISEEDLTTPSTFDDVLDPDLEAIDLGRSREGGIWRRPSIYVAAFEEMINTVVSYELHLLSENEKNVLMAIRCLRYNARYCLFRLILRKSDTWHTVSSMNKYEKEVGEEGLHEAIDELCLPVGQIIENRPISEPSTSQSQSQTSSQIQPPATSSIPSSVESSEPEGPEVIDLTFSDDEEDVKPNLIGLNRVNAEAGPSDLSRYAQSRSPVTLKPSLNNLSNPEWDSEFRFLCEDDTNMTLDEALNKLSLPQLRDLAKEMKVKPAKQNKSSLILALRQNAIGQSILNFDPKGKAKSRTPQKDGPRQTILPFMHRKMGGRCKQSQEERLMQMALKKLGRSVRINTEIYWLVVRLNIIYERSIEYPKSFLVPSLLTSFKKRTYPVYEYNRDPTIWATRQDLLDYVEALRLEAAIEEEMQSRPDQTDLKTPIPGSDNRLSTSHTPTPRLSATPLRTSIAPQENEPPPVKKEPPDNHIKIERHIHAGPDSKFNAREMKLTRARAIKELFEARILPKWEELLAAKEKQPPEARAPGLVRFEPGYVYTRMASTILDALATLEERREELVMLEALLSQRHWRRGKRAKWYERRALLLERYISKFPGDHKPKRNMNVLRNALEGLKEALQDEDTGLVYRPALLRRLRRLEKILEIPAEECVQCDGQLREAKKVYHRGVRIYETAASLKLDAHGQPKNTNKPESIQKHFPVVTSPSLIRRGPKAEKENIPETGLPSDKWKWKGKSIWRGKDGDEINVETLALEYYEKLGWKGFHSESRVVTTIFSFLMWDVIFTDIPGAFETPHQTAPLDLATDIFYRARKEEIESRLEELKSPGRAVEILLENYDRECKGKTWCIGIRWDICERQDLIEIVQCLGGSVLAIVCRLLCQDYSGRASGVPDLITWNLTLGICKFVEVKGPGDRPQENQKLWFDTLLGAGAHVELCYVFDANEPPKPPKVKKPGRKKKKAKRVASEPDGERMDVESEDEDEVDPDESMDADDMDGDTAGSALPIETRSESRKRQRSPSLSEMLPPTQVVRVEEQSIISAQRSKKARESPAKRKRKSI